MVQQENSTPLLVQSREIIQRYKDMSADEVSSLLNVPISQRKVNGQHAHVMRDSGFSFAAVCERYVLPKQYLDEWQEVLLMDCTPRTFQKARIHVETEYSTGYLDVYVVENPVVDLVFGNINDMNGKAKQRENEGKKKDSRSHIKPIMVQEIT